MPENINVASFAKINLHLEVGSGRFDGFHEIYSIFQIISLHDTLEISVSNKTNDINDSIEINGNFTCSKENNLIFKAASIFMKNTGLRFNTEINAVKRIPEGAGLGGGSSNAAAILKSLNQMTGNPLDREKLLKIASEIGSDVPFFLGNCTTAVVMGKGDIIKPVYSEIPEYHLVLVYPGFNINTAAAYRWVDEDRQSGSCELKKIEPSVLLLNPSKWDFDNTFRLSLEKRFDIYSKIFSVFSEKKSDYFNITGSGSAVFGIFTDLSNAEACSKELKEFCPGVWIANTLAGRLLPD